MRRKTSLVVILLALCKQRMLANRGLSETVFHAFRPTFAFLKGQTKVEQVRGANKAYVLFCISPISSSSRSISALENAVRRHSSGSTSATFSGRGQSLGGSSGAPPPPRNDRLEALLGNLDPQVKK